MQIDILIAVTPQEIAQAVSTLTSLIIDCDVPCRAAVLMHGGPRKDFAELDEFLAPSEVEEDRPKESVMHPFKWRVEHVQKKLPFNTRTARVGYMQTNKIAALVVPGFVTNDPKWFGKVQQTFIKDPRNMLSIVLPFINATLHPNRALPTDEFDGQMIIGGIDLQAILAGCLSGPGRFARDLRSMTKKLGGNRWLLESIRYDFVGGLEVQKSERLR